MSRDKITVLRNSPPLLPENKTTKIRKAKLTHQESAEEPERNILYTLHLQWIYCTIIVKTVACVLGRLSTLPHTGALLVPTTKYIVRLSQEEHQFLESVVKKGKGGAFKIRRAQILLHSDVNGPGASAATIRSDASLSGSHCLWSTKTVGGKRFWRHSGAQKATEPSYPSSFWWKSRSPVNCHRLQWATWRSKAVGPWNYCLSV